VGTVVEITQNKENSGSNNSNDANYRKKCTQAFVHEFVPPLCYSYWGLYESRIKTFLKNLCNGHKFKLFAQFLRGNIIGISIRGLKTPHHTILA
jgi:hypothetical protein